MGDSTSNGGSGSPSTAPTRRLEPLLRALCLDDAATVRQWLDSGLVGLDEPLFLATGTPGARWVGATGWQWGVNRCPPRSEAQTSLPAASPSALHHMIALVYT
jgi:hypothetical protein